MDLAGAETCSKDVLHWEIHLSQMESAMRQMYIVSVLRFLGIRVIFACLSDFSISAAKHRRTRIQGIL